MTPRVLAAYPEAIRACTWIPHPISDGFSGAQLWRGEWQGEPLFALKQWPDQTPFARLRQIHSWMQSAQQAHLEFVPRIVDTSRNESVVSFEGRLWDCGSWMPGRPLDQPIRNQIELGCQALARLHRTWKPVGETRASCPAIQRRLAIFDHWDQRPQSLRATPGWVLASTEWLRTQLPRVRAELIRWLAVPVPVHPCLCDAHSAHILFSDHRVSGIIDYGAMKLDSPAVDLARWLGDLVPSSSEEFRHGIAAYRAILDPAESPPDKLVMVLARSGSLAALANWQLRWGNPGQHWCASFEHRVNAILERCVAEFR